MRLLICAAIVTQFVTHVGATSAPRPGNHWSFDPGTGPADAQPDNVSRTWREWPNRMMPRLSRQLLAARIASYETRWPGRRAGAARMKLIGGDSGRYEHEELVDQVLLAPRRRRSSTSCSSALAPVDVGAGDLRLCLLVQPADHTVATVSDERGGDIGDAARPRGRHRRCERQQVVVLPGVWATRRSAGPVLPGHARVGCGVVDVAVGRGGALRYPGDRGG